MASSSTESALAGLGAALDAVELEERIRAECDEKMRKVELKWMNRTKKFAEKMKMRLKSSAAEIERLKAEVRMLQNDCARSPLRGRSHRRSASPPLPKRSRRRSETPPLPINGQRMRKRFRSDDRGEFVSDRQRRRQRRRYEEQISKHVYIPSYAASMIEGPTLHAIAVSTDTSIQIHPHEPASRQCTYSLNIKGRKAEIAQQLIEGEL